MEHLVVNEQVFSKIDNSYLQDVPGKDPKHLYHCYTSFQLKATNGNPLVKNLYQERCIVLESDVLKQISNMLLGISGNIFMIDHDSNEFKLGERVVLTHLLPETLDETLDFFLELGTIILKLRRFTEFQTVNVSDKQSNLTYQAYATSLAEILDDLRKQISQMGCKTLLELEHYLYENRITDKLYILYEIYLHGVYFVKQKERCNNAYQASCLLSVIYLILEDKSKTVRHPEDFQLAMKLFVDSFQPYLRMIYKWIDQGVIEDPFQEFMIQENRILSLAEPESLEFWQQGFNIQTYENMPNNLLHVTPSFLVSVQNSLLLCGKSVHMIRSIFRNTPAKLAEYEASASLATSLPFAKNLEELFSLYEDTWATFCFQDFYKHDHGMSRGTETVFSVDNVTHVSFTEQYEGGETSELNTSDLGSPIADSFNEDPSQELITKRTFLSGTANVILTSIEMASKEHSKFVVESTVLDSSLTYNMSMELHTNDAPRFCGLPNASSVLVPIKVILDECLLNNIIIKNRKVGSYLLELLLKECQLIEHFDALQHLFFMEAGFEYHQFSINLFLEVDQDEEWADENRLNAILRESLASNHNSNIISKSELFTLELVTSTFQNAKSSVDFLEKFFFTYEAPWPISLLINRTTISEFYNPVLVFLLQIKRSKYVLDTITVRNKSRQTAGFNQSHRLMVLRSKLLHFMNNLQNYIVTRVVKTEGQTLKRKIETAQDFDHVSHLHQEYLILIRDTCLLNPKAIIVLNTIKKIMNSCVKLSNIWKNLYGEENVVSSNQFMKEILRLEEEFKQCVTFLITVLTKIVNQKKLPYLDDLLLRLTFGS